VRQGELPLGRLEGGLKQPRWGKGGPPARRSAQRSGSEEMHPGTRAMPAWLKAFPGWQCG